MKRRIYNFYLGIFFCIVIALSSQFLSNYLGTEYLKLENNPVSPIFMALLIGILATNISNIFDNYDHGISFCSKAILKAGIILMGLRISLNEMMAFGIKGILIVTPCIIFTLLFVKYSRDYFKITSKLATLIAVGTSICGATAIIATAPSIKARKEEVTYAIANISIFGIFGMLIYPHIAYYLFDDNSILAGLFLGSSIHETAQVAGAGMIYADKYLSPVAFDVSTVTKLVRNTAMIVVIPYLSLSHVNSSINNGATEKNHYYQIFPFFILGFILLGMIRTFVDYGINENHIVFGFLKADDWKLIIDGTNDLSKFFLVVAMSAIGLSTDIKKLKSLGIRIFYYGFAVAVFVGIVSALLTFIFFE